MLQSTIASGGPARWPYRRSRTDPLQHEADPADLELLDQAFAYLDQGLAYREVATWLSANATRPIHHYSLRRLYVRHCAARRQSDVA